MVTIDWYHSLLFFFFFFKSCWRYRWRVFVSRVVDFIVVLVRSSWDNRDQEWPRGPHTHTHTTSHAHDLTRTHTSRIYYINSKNKNQAGRIKIKSMQSQRMCEPSPTRTAAWAMCHKAHCCCCCLRTQDTHAPFLGHRRVLMSRRPGDRLLFLPSLSPRLMFTEDDTHLTVTLDQVPPPHTHTSSSCLHVGAHEPKTHAFHRTDSLAFCIFFFLPLTPHSVDHSVLWGCRSKPDLVESKGHSTSGTYKLSIWPEGVTQWGTGYP